MPDFKRKRRSIWRQLHGKSEIGICCICKNPLNKEEATLEHIIARADGGTNKIQNLGLAHKKCNNDRGSVLYSRKIAPHVAQYLYDVTTGKRKLRRKKRHNCLIQDLKKRQPLTVEICHEEYLRFKKAI